MFQIRRDSSSGSFPSAWLKLQSVAYPGIFFREGSTNSFEDRGQRDGGSRGVAPYLGVLEAAVIWYKKFHFV